MIATLLLAGALSQCPPGMTCYTVPPPYTATDSAGWFLLQLNAERRRYGLPAVSWDARLAAYAARNTSYHAPASRAPYSSQVWAGTQSYRQAYSLWMRSPPHRAILLNARAGVGAAYCPSGITCNAR